MESLEERVAKLEEFVSHLKGALGVPLNGGAQSSTKQPKQQQNQAATTSLPVAGDDLLMKDWGNPEIKKDPPRWAGESFVGKLMSECSPEYLNEYAGFYDWKASKGREENPPRLNSKGKPWFETDELVAKLARGWAKHRRAGTLPGEAAYPHQVADEDIPF